MREPLFMLIDDNDIDLFLNKKFLQLSGISNATITCNSAVTALKKLLIFQQEGYQMPDVILLDIQMPGMDGFSFLDQLNEEKSLEYYHPSIIMLSSTTDPKDFERAESYASVGGILSKPLNPELLRQYLLLRA